MMNPMVVKLHFRLNIEQVITKNVFYYTLLVSCMRDVQGPIIIYFIVFVKILLIKL
jgi:hypothetical protein